MKKVMLSLALIAMTVALAAQEKGDFYVSGYFGIDGGSTSTSTTTGGQKVSSSTPSGVNFQIGPKAGYFILDRLEVNLALDYQLARTDPNIHSTVDRNFYDFTHVFSITPGVNYYLPICDRLYYNPGFYLSLGFGSSRERFDENTVTRDGITAFGFGFRLVSFEFQPCEHFAITLNAGDFSYTLTHTGDENTGAGTTVKTSTNINTVGFDINLGTSIGFKYYF